MIRIQSGDCWFANWSPYMEGKERLKKQADYSSLVGGRFTKQGNLHSRVVLGSHKPSRSSHLPARTLQVYLGLKWIQCKWSQQHIGLSRLCPWKWLPLWEQWAELTFQGWEGVRSLQLPRSSSRVTWQSRPLNDLLHQRLKGSTLSLLPLKFPVLELYRTGKERPM